MIQTFVVSIAIFIVVCLLFMLAQCINGQLDY